MMSNTQGKLFVVATPIGNLNDVSVRMLEILHGVDVILCEDTRISKRLLERHGISTRLESLHQHNEQARIPHIVEKLQAGSDYALISDAGTPAVSDPGRLLVAAVLAADITVAPLPGPNAAISALSCSGFDADSFVFEGFLPARQSVRRHRLLALKNETRSLIFYEAPHRIEKMLVDISDIFGAKREGCLAKELTKINETIFVGSFAEIQQWLAQDVTRRKGEFVVIAKGCDDSKEDNQEQEKLLRILLEHLSPRQAVAIASQFGGAGKNELYKKALELRGHDT